MVVMFWCYAPLYAHTSRDFPSFVESGVFAADKFFLKSARKNKNELTLWLYLRDNFLIYRVDKI